VKKKNIFKYIRIVLYVGLVIALILLRFTDAVDLRKLLYKR